MKTQNEYLIALEEELKYLKIKETKKVIKFYRDKINVSLDYGEEEAKVIAKLPHPKIVAQGVYDQKGIDFIKYQTKKIKRKKLIDAITSIGALLIVTLGFLVALLYMSIIFINKFLMVIHFLNGNMLEVFLNEGFILTYLLISIIIIIFIFDLYIIIFNFLFIKINENIFLNFSFRKLSDKLTQNTNFLGKFLGLASLIFLVFGFLSFINKTYFYRVLIDYPKNEQIYEVTKPIDEISFSNYEAKIYIVEGTTDTIKIKHQFEFDRSFKIIQEEQKLEIQTNNSKTYDLLNLIKEPIQIITIYLPKSICLKQMNFDLTKGLIAFQKIELENLTLNMAFGDIAIQDTKINKIQAIFNQVEFGLNNNDLDEVNLEQKRGLFKVKNDSIKYLIVNSNSADIGIEGLTSNTFKINSKASTVVLVDLNCQNFESSLDVGNFYLKRFNIDILKMSGSNNKINFTEGIFNSLTMKLSGGTVWGDDLQGVLILLEDSSSNITLLNVSGSIDFDNEGDISIEKSILTNLNLKILFKTLFLKDINFEQGEITITQGIGNLEEVYGITLTLHLDNTTFIYTNQDESKFYEELIKDFKNETVDSINGVNVRKKE